MSDLFPTRSIVSLLVITCGLVHLAPPQAEGVTLLRNICRIKGQEENVLRGRGLVIGLNGTGEANDPPTMRALARAMELTGGPIPEASLNGLGGLKELEKYKNIALVMVSVHVPASGSRRGDKLDCQVGALNGKSLDGGYLFAAALQGPNTTDNKVYALAEGPIQLDDDNQPLVGRIHAGCQMEEDIFTPFVENGTITLILEKNHANFQTITEIVETIRSTHSSQSMENSKTNNQTVQALNASNIMIRIPPIYINDPVLFISEILDTQIYQSSPEARVVINERAGSIVISGEVEIGGVVVSHKNVVIEAGETPVAQFSQLDPEKANPAKLQSLVDALGALKVPHTDVVEIIKRIERSGNLHAQLIIE